MFATALTMARLFATTETGAAATFDPARYRSRVTGALLRIAADGEPRTGPQLGWLARQEVPRPRNEPPYYHEAEREALSRSAFLALVEAGAFVQVGYRAGSELYAIARPNPPRRRASSGQAALDFSAPAPAPSRRERYAPSQAGALLASWRHGGRRGPLPAEVSAAGEDLADWRWGMGA